MNPSTGVQERSSWQLLDKGGGKGTVMQEEFVTPLFTELKHGSVLPCGTFVIRQKIKLTESTKQSLNLFTIYGFQAQL